MKANTLKSKNLIVLTLASTIWLQGIPAGVEVKFRDYKKPIQFEVNHIIQFPDFSIVFKGSESIAMPFGLPSMSREHFEVTSSKGEKFQVYWNDSGDIAPAAFEINGQKFWLELKTSELLGGGFRKLKDNEFIVRPAP